MNKIYSTITIVCFSILCTAQIPDFSFENWKSYTGAAGKYDAPDGWVTTNHLMDYTPVPVSVTRDSTPHSGSLAMKLSSFKYLNLQAGKYDTSAAIAVTGYKGFFGAVGYNFDKRPVALKLFYRYNPDGNDTARVVILLSKATVTGFDTIGYASINIIAGETSYKELTLPITYKTASKPDTSTIMLYSGSDFSPALNSVFVVDDVSYEYAVNIDEAFAGEKNVIVYYNSSVDMLEWYHISNASAVIDVYSVDGKRMERIFLENNRFSSSTINYAPGVYLFTSKDRIGNIVEAGRFIISK